MQGMNPDPGKSYSIADRFSCGRCGETPRIVKAQGNGPVTLTFTCHGETVTQTYEKKDLVFDQILFEETEG